MKNVIVLLIDSVYSDTLGNKRTEISSTPFIDSLKENAVFAPNVYSYGPYTDAASKALYCGNRTLDDYGYFFGLNSSEYNHFRLFSENGYETYGVYYPYYLLGSDIEKYIDHSLYTGGFKYTSVWGGKFEYYANEQKKRPLTEQECTLVSVGMRLVFDCWSLFYRNIEEQEGSGDIIHGIVNEKLKGTGKKGLDEEIRKFNADPKAYMDGVLKAGMDHELAKINEFDYGRDVDFDFYKEIYDKHNKFFKKLKRANVWRNLRNNPISIKRSFKNCWRFLKTRDKTELRYFGNYGMLLCHTGMMKKRSLTPKWQDLSSLNRQIEVLLNNLDKRDKSSDKPFYASIHALEPHHNISFFSFDSFDHGLIDEEIEYLSPMIKGCGKKFSGNLLYQVSLRYVDLCVKRLYTKLEERGLLDDTVIMLVSDHGTSYTFDPVRTRVVNTFHKENYNIPLLIWDKNISKEAAGSYTGTYCSDDVYPTLCDLLGIEAPKQFTGKSMMKNKSGREYVITEYMGPGVPDMLQREVWISIRNDKYVVAYKNPISKELDMDNPCCVYDLTADPDELKDLSTKIGDSDELCEMKKILNARFVEIQNNTTLFLRKEENEESK